MTVCIWSKKTCTCEHHVMVYVKGLPADYSLRAIARHIRRELPCVVGLGRGGYDLIARGRISTQQFVDFFVNNTDLTEEDITHSRRDLIDFKERTW